MSKTGNRQFVKLERLRQWANKVTAIEVPWQPDTAAYQAEIRAAHYVLDVLRGRDPTYRAEDGSLFKAGDE